MDSHGYETFAIVSHVYVSREFGLDRDEAAGRLTDRAVAGAVGRRVPRGRCGEVSGGADREGDPDERPEQGGGS